MNTVSSDGFRSALHTLKFVFSSPLFETVLRGGTGIAAVANSEGKRRKESQRDSVNSRTTCRFIPSSAADKNVKTAREMIVRAAAVPPCSIILKQGQLRNQRTTQRRKVQLRPNDW